MKPQLHKKGFTLVELSIVLVIIGLLIGGILAAQSMIATARLQAFVRQIQQYDIAVTNHLQKFNTWPGDDDLYQAVIRADCGSGHFPALNDRIITDGCAQNQGYTIGTETGNYFPELKVLDSLVIDNCPTIDNAGPFSALVTRGSTCNAVSGKYGKNTYVFVFSNQEYGGQNFGGIYYFLFDCSNTITGQFDSGTSGRCNPPFSGMESLAYDSKIDDGKPNSGIVASSNSFPGSGNFGSTLRLPYVDLPVSYSTSSNVPTYAMIQKVAPMVQP